MPKFCHRVGMASAWLKNMFKQAFAAKRLPVQNGSTRCNGTHGRLCLAARKGAPVEWPGCALPLNVRVVIWLSQCEREIVLIWLSSICLRGGEHVHF